MPAFVQSRFSLEERRAVAARLEGGEKAEALAAELGVHKAQVYRWRRNELGLPNGARKGAARAKAEVRAAEALEVLEGVMKGDSSDSTRVTAARAILERTLGRPGQVREKPRRKPSPARIEWVFEGPEDVPGHPAHTVEAGD